MYLSMINKGLHIVLEKFLTNDSSSKLRLIGMDDVINDFEDLQYRVVTYSSEAKGTNGTAPETTQDVILELHVQVTDVNYWLSNRNDIIDNLHQRFPSHQDNYTLITERHEKLKEGHDFAFIINCTKVCLMESKKLNELISSLSKLRTYVLGARLYRTLSLLSSSASVSNRHKIANDVAVFHLPVRKHRGACLIIRHGSDRVSIIFDVHYNDINERAIARTYLKQFSDLSRHCEYRKWNDLPTELKQLDRQSLKDERGAINLKRSNISAGFLVFTFSASEDFDDDRSMTTTNFMIMFLINLQMQVKATKTDLYARVRHNGDMFLTRFTNREQMKS